MSPEHCTSCVSACSRWRDRSRLLRWLSGFPAFCHCALRTCIVSDRLDMSRSQSFCASLILFTRCFWMRSCVCAWSCTWPQKSDTFSDRCLSTDDDRNSARASTLASCSVMQVSSDKMSFLTKSWCWLTWLISCGGRCVSRQSDCRHAGHDGSSCAIRSMPLCTILFELRKSDVRFGAYFSIATNSFWDPRSVISFSDRSSAVSEYRDPLAPSLQWWVRASTPMSPI